MLQEAMEVFQIMLQEKGERIITDAYIPKDGTYRLIVMKDDGWVIKDPVDIIFNKKTNTVDISNDMDYLLIQELDYKSKLLEMNKPIDPKKVIHSNNYLSLAVKKESVTSGKLSEEIIQQYYEILRNPNKKYENKPQARALYHVAEERLGQPDIEAIDKIEKFILANKEDIWKGINLEKKNYVKLFFVYQEEEKTKEIYKIESERYLIPNIYNNNNFNMEFEKGIVGLPNDNMGMNSKKPYLENKTRKVKVPYLLDQESALLQSKFFDYLFGQVSKKRFHIYVDNIDKKICSYTNKDKPEDIVSGYYLRCRMGKAGAEICEADVITHYKTKLEPGLVLKNYIEIPEERIEKSKIHYDEAIEDQWVIMDLINGIFFEGKLKNNFFTDARDMNIYDDCLKQSILKSRNILANWFWRGEQNQLVKILDDVSLALIKNSILNDETFAAQRKFNLRWSLLEYLDDQEVGVHMSEIRNQLREHINVAKDVEWDFISDEEYSYAVGQAVSYLLHLSKANNKTESYVNPFFNAKNSKVIKQRLLRMYTKYNYQIIHINGGRNAQLLSHVMEYEPKEIKHELIMAGFTAPSLMYEKKTDDEDNE